MTLTTSSTNLVSIIIPVYNREQYIGAALESVLSQSYRPLEIIVVDDGSSDRTAEIVKRFDDQVSYVYRANGGPAAARNHGLALASGEFIAFLDSDDLWPATKLETQIRYLLGHTEVQYVIGKATYFAEPGTTLPSGFREELLDGGRTAQLLQAMVARKSVFDRVGNFNIQLRTAEDVDWFCRANDLKIPMAAVEEVVLNIRVHGENTSLKESHNNHYLMQALRQSIQRKKAMG
jgi:glycosyltransferase involved in cell wall biosynthesis